MVKSSPGFSNAFEMTTDDTSLIVEIGKSGGTEDITFDEIVLVQRKLDKSSLRLRDLAFGKEVFLGIGEIAEIS